MVLEVFIAFTRETDVKELKRTMEAWNLDGLEPVAIQCGLPAAKFEMHRRVTAENLSINDYVLAGLGCEPVEDDFGELAETALRENHKVGLIEPGCVGTDWVSGRVVICRRGVIKRWVDPHGSQEADVLHANAHRQSYRLAGYERMECKTIHYRLLNGSSPS